MRRPILIAFTLLLAACGVKLDLERDILDGADNAVVWMTNLRDDIPLARLSIPGAHDAATSSPGSCPLIVNHVSGYTGTLPDYRANARNVNARAAEYIRSRDIPAGIVMMDFAGVDQSKGKDVGGALLVKTLIENNLKR